MPCEIKAHRIYRDGKAVGFQRTANIGGTIVPQVIVLHDTAGDLSGRGSISWLIGGPKGSQNSSAHVVIGRDGTITQLAAMNVKTWHAGQSSWRGRQLLNGWSIGIEIANPGGPLRDMGNGTYKGGVSISPRNDPSLVVRRGKFPPRTDDGKAMAPNDGLWLEHSPQQIDAVVDLCRALVAAYPTITEIVTHWMIAPTRKVDTNPLFPLAEVRARVFGPAKPVTIARFADLDGIDAGAPGLIDQPSPGTNAPIPVRNDDGNDEDVTDTDPKFPTAEMLAKVFGPVKSASESHPMPKALVEFVQQRLRALGYYEVGNVDGDFEVRTEDALVTFKRRNGLPLTPQVDEATLVALAKATPRKVGNARATATAKDLRTAVPAMQQAARSKALAWLLGVPSAMFAGIQGVVTNISGATAQLAPIQSVFGSVPGWLWALLVICVAFGIWWYARKAEAETVEAYRAGRLT